MCSNRTIHTTPVVSKEQLPLVSRYVSIRQCCIELCPKLIYIVI